MWNSPVVRLLRTFGLVAGLALGCQSAAAQNPPEAPREFRGMWIATVWNVDWPSRKGLSSQQMRGELQEMIRSARAAGMNAVVMQVRAYSDAMYDSPLDPWSEFLTGTMGQAPGGGFDPMKFAIEECRRQGMLFHAWVNPFRAGSAQTATSNKHISRRHPEVVRRLGTNLWADPGEPVARKFALDVIRDIVTRYDVDAIQFDDKGFYPYQSDLRTWTGSLEFPDDESFRRHGRGFGSRADWRRNNITTFLRESNAVIKSVKPDVMLGVSPFGIHRPGEPPGITGTSAYDTLYTDCKAWMRQGLVDYMAPQLYWPVASKGQPFEPLLKWWVAQNGVRRHMWPGVWSGKYDSSEILNKIEITRATRGAGGLIHYHGKPFRNNSNGRIRDALAQGPYSYPALVPRSPWLGSTAPQAPSGVVTRESGGMRLQIQPAPEGPRPLMYSVYARTGSGWSFAVVPAVTGTMTIPGANAPRAIFVAAVDRLGNESQKVQVPLP